MTTGTCAGSVRAPAGLIGRGEVGLPYSVELEEELRTCRGFLNSSGKLQIVAKDEWRQFIHRSPDRLDALMMAVAGRLSGELTGPVAF